MKCTAGFDKYVNDKLIVRWHDKEAYRIFSQRKRLPNNTPKVILDIQKEYLKSAVYAIKFIHVNYNYRLRTAIDIFNTLRGENILSQHLLNSLLGI